MRLQSISLLFHCYWKRQRGPFLWSMDDINLASFPASLSPLPHVCVPLFFRSSPKDGHHSGWSNPVQGGSVTAPLRSIPKNAQSLKALLEGWDMKAGRHIPQPFAASSPHASSFNSFPPPLSYPSSFVLLHFFILLPFLLVFTAIPQSTLL